ncbi:MAG: UMP kinase [Deltaproteobacteria bacterium]|nr:UMP kinase [Deltaproteobacteria bacterium]
MCDPALCALPAGRRDLINVSAAYRRILLKLSGEALAGGKRYGFDPDTLHAITANVIDALDMGIQVGIVIGGGNIFRGMDAGITSDRVSADHMGMLATVINALALKGSIERQGRSSKVFSAVDMPKVAQTFVASAAIECLEKSQAVIFAGGTGCPFFTTDTTAALRALEIQADVLIKATKVNGVYDKDPVKYPDAVFYPELDYDQVLSMNLGVMDATAISLCRDNDLIIRVINIKDPENLKGLLAGRSIGSIVKPRRECNGK